MEKRKQKQKDQMLLNFLDHCATIIQSHFRAYQQRKYYRKFLPIYRRFKQLFLAGFHGWKTRRIIKLTRMKKKITEIQTYQKCNKDLQARIAKRDFTDDFIKLYKNGTWMEFFSKQNIKNKMSQISKPLRISNKTNLKQAFKIVSRLPNNNKNKSIERWDKKPKQKKLTIKDKNQCQKQNQSQQIKQFQNNGVSSIKQLKIKQKSQKRSTVLQITLQPQLIQLNDKNYETPSSNAYTIKRPTLGTYKKEEKQSESDKLSESSLQKINNLFQNFSKEKGSKKGGLKMTLSKKFNETIQKEINQANCTKMVQLKNFNIQAACSIKEGTNKFQKTTIVSDFDSLLEADTLKNTLRIKKDEFERKKLEHQKKVSQFKKIALN